jgi:hypothetical protein
MPAAALPAGGSIEEEEEEDKITDKTRAGICSVVERSLKIARA